MGGDKSSKKQGLRIHIPEFLVGVWPERHLWYVPILWRNEPVVLSWTRIPKIHHSVSSNLIKNLVHVSRRKVVEDVPRGVHVNFLKAERSLHRWALEDLQRIHAAEELASEEGAGVQMHVLEDAGHWVRDKILCFILMIHFYWFALSGYCFGDPFRFMRIILMAYSGFLLRPSIGSRRSERQGTRWSIYIDPFEKKQFFDEMYEILHLFD